MDWVSKKKAKQKYHKTKSSREHIVRDLTVLDGGGLKWNNAQFLLIWMPLETETETEISGLFINENLYYKYEGAKQHGYSLLGMSGGALFQGPRKLNSNGQNINDWFNLVGIGLEYDGVRVKGVSKN